MSHDAFKGVAPAMLDRSLSLQLVEYQALKEEQLRRIGDRDHFVYAQLLAVGAVLAMVIEGRAPLLALLAVPFVSSVLASLYVSNDEIITAIAEYIDRELRARASAADVPGAFGWEAFRLKDPRRRSRKAAEMWVLKSVFFVPSLVGMGYGLWRIEELTVGVLVLLPLFLAPLVPFAREVAAPRPEHPQAIIHPR